LGERSIADSRGDELKIKKQLVLSHGVLVVLSLLIVVVNIVVYQSLESDAQIVNNAGQLRKLSYNLAQLNSQLNDGQFNQVHILDKMQDRFNQFENILLSFQQPNHPFQNYQDSATRMLGISNRWEKSFKPCYEDFINETGELTTCIEINNNVDDFVRDIDALVQGYSDLSKRKVMIAYVINLIFIIAIIVVTSYSFITTNNQIRKPMTILLNELKDLSHMDENMTKNLKSVESNEIAKMSQYFNEMMYDQLTRAFNRRAGLSRLKRLMETNNSLADKISLCFIDINGLKEVNDKLGHKHGDDLIIQAINGIKNAIRDSDFVVRMGGDEFLVVFCHINEEQAEEVWSRIAKYYIEINAKDDRPYNISVSHGIVDFDTNDHAKIEELIKKADEKMYSEKRVLKDEVKVKIIK